MSLTEIIRHNLKFIPTHLANIYCTLIENTLVIDKLLGSSRLKNLYKLYNYGPVTFSENVIFLEQGEMGLRESFFKANKIEGRVDNNPPFLNTTQMMQFIALSSMHRFTDHQLNDIYNRVKKVKRIILLSDISISGTSLIGDHKDITKLFELILGNERSIEVVVFLATATEESIKNLSKNFNQIYIDEIIPNDFSLKYTSCMKLTEASAKVEISELLEWFAQEVINSNDNYLQKMSRIFKDQDSLSYGFGGEGWLISTDHNTPNNSLPLLWYSSENHPYLPPFPRVSSRTYDSQQWNLRNVYQEIIEQS